MKNDPVNNPKQRTKFCGTCKQDAPIDLFVKNRAKKDGLQERCTPCRSKHYQEKGKLTRQKPTKEQKRKYLIKSYGLSVHEFEALYTKQHGRCAICNSSNWGKPSPSIDHDHNTNKVRGLLCNNCNRGLGLLGDSTDNLRSALEYLIENT